MRQLGRTKTHQKTHEEKIREWYIAAIRNDDPPHIIRRAKLILEITHETLENRNPGDKYIFRAPNQKFPRDAKDLEEIFGAAAKLYGLRFEPSVNDSDDTAHHPFALFTFAKL